MLPCFLWAAHSSTWVYSSATNTMELLIVRQGVAEVLASDIVPLHSGVFFTDSLMSSVSTCCGLGMIPLILRRSWKACRDSSSEACSKRKSQWVTQIHLLPFVTVHELLPSYTLLLGWDQRWLDDRLCLGHFPVHHLRPDPGSFALVHDLLQVDLVVITGGHLISRNSILLECFRGGVNYYSSLAVWLSFDVLCFSIY